MLVQGLLLTDPTRAPAPGWLRVDPSIGRIEELGEGAPPRSSNSTHAKGSTADTIGGVGTIVCPAFIDAHLHIPQFGAEGCEPPPDADNASSNDSVHDHIHDPLLGWLDRVAYPAETWFGAGAAKQVTRNAVRTLVREGTFGFAGYLSSHARAAAEATQTLTSGSLPPLRCALGRVAMDREAPEDLTYEDRWRAQQNPRPSVALPAELLHSGASLHTQRMEISINPRFAAGCSEELLAECGWWVQEQTKHGTPPIVQTHLAESPGECDRVAKLFPHASNYTSIYDTANLLTPRTLLAHCVRLSSDEWQRIAKRECVAVHCPTANLFLRSGFFDLDAATDHGVRIALGSDVAGGPDAAMPRVARAMIETTKVRATTTHPKARVATPAEAWHSITRGNADALGWTDSGRLEAGAWADLLVLRVPATWMDEHLVGRLLYNWSPSLIASRVVAGRLVDPATL